MPVKTKIAVEADADKFKQSFALFQKYQTALKKQYGEYVAKAPNIKATTVAGDDLSKFVNGLDRVASSQGKLAGGAEKAARAFHGLGVGVKSTLESFRRVALSPLQVLFPAGLAVGLFGLGAGLAGIGLAGATVYGLDRAASGVSDRRRRALGLGISYGSLTAYDVDFSRFGVGEETLGAVAGGIYNFASPEYLGLRALGATGGDTSEAAIALMRSIPEKLRGVPDQQVGAVARSLGLTNLLDLPTIIRLRNHPEEIEAQVKRYREDRASFNISQASQQAWAAFNAQIERAGRDIESAVGRNLVALTPALTKFSQDANDFLTMAIDSGAVGGALKAIKGGLQWLDTAIESPEFKAGSRRFLSGLETLGPYVAKFLLNTAHAVFIGGRWVYYGAKLAGDPSYNPDLPTFIGDLAGQKQPGREVPPNDPILSGRPSIRYYAGHEAERPPSNAIDSVTGKRTPAPPFRYSPQPGPKPQGPSEVRNQNGNVVLPAIEDQSRAYRNVGTLTVPGPDGKLHTFGFVTGGGGRGSAPTGEYEIGEFATGGAIGDRWTLTEVGQPHDTAFDPALNAERSALRIHMAHGYITLGCIGILGGDKVFADFKNDLLYVMKANGGHVRLRLGSPDANAIVSRMRPTSAASKGRVSDYIADKKAYDAPGAGPPLQLPGARPDMGIGDTLKYDNLVGLRNPALKARGRSLHILDHMDKGPPPGPITIDNQTGGAAQVTVSPIPYSP